MVETHNILGIGFRWKDKIETDLRWKKTIDINDDMKIDTRFKYNSTRIQANIDFDYTERVYNIKYFNVFDILSRVGGITETAMIFIELMFPWIALFFLYKLAFILDKTILECQVKEMH